MAGVHEPVKILVTGAFGQIGTELVPALCRRYGSNDVLATGRRVLGDFEDACAVAELDVTEGRDVEALVNREAPQVIYHLAAVLSAKGELDPQLAWRVNMDGLYNVLEAARRYGVAQVFWPSSIAVFGPSTPRDAVPQETVMRPTTIYGASKVAGELLGDYYASKYRLDVRGVRYPGVISRTAKPGGGTTDYAVDIFRSAIAAGHYTCFVREDCVLPMMYMPDCVTAALTLMDADRERLHYQTGYNVAAMSFSVGELVDEIRKHTPTFTCNFRPDDRQRIADTWPRSLDDSAARDDWAWRHEFDLARMTKDMLSSDYPAKAGGR